MKFKRTIASVLAATFSLTLMGSSVPKIFAEKTAEIVTEEKVNINSEKEEVDEQSKTNKSKKENETSFKSGIKNILRHPIKLAVSALLGLTSVAIFDHVIISSINTLATDTHSTIRFVVPKSAYAIIPLLFVLLEAFDLYDAADKK